MNNEFDNAVLQLSDNLRRILTFVPEDIKNSTQEIRLRLNLPLTLTVNGEVYFVCNNSRVTDCERDDCFTVTKQDLDSTLIKLCNNSVYLHENEIKQGYVSLSGGNRAGVCGAFNSEGILVAVTSINVRIARQILGCAKNLLPYAKNGLLIAGPPASGKTTVLRDLIRLISNGEDGRYRRVAVIDSRGEISGGISKLDLGINTDVLYLKDKSIGTQIALRTMFPNVIAFDEIGTNDEFKEVKECFNAGVDIITTVHCTSVFELSKREIIVKIIKSGAVKYIAVLTAVGVPPHILEANEVLNNA